MLSNACAFVLGPFGQSIAVLFIMGLGIAWMAGRASLHLLGQVIGGIVLLFGAAYICGYCRSTEELQVDHRISVARGGSNALENLITACGPCNLSKGSKAIDDWSNSRTAGKKVAQQR